MSLQVGSDRSREGVRDLDDAPVLRVPRAPLRPAPLTYPSLALVQPGAPAASLPSVLPRSLSSHTHTLHLHSFIALFYSLSVTLVSPTLPPLSLHSVLTPPLYVLPGSLAPSLSLPFYACRSLAPMGVAVSALLRVSVFTQQQIILESVKSKAYLRIVVRTARYDDQTK